MQFESGTTMRETIRSTLRHEGVRRAKGVIEIVLGKGFYEGMACTCHWKDSIRDDVSENQSINKI